MHADENIAGLDLCADADDSAFVEVAQKAFRDVRDVLRDFLGAELGVARFDIEFFDVDGGVVVLFDELFADEDGVLEVIAAPGHEGHENIAAEG